MDRDYRESIIDRAKRWKIISKGGHNLSFSFEPPKHRYQRGTEPSTFAVTRSIRVL